MRILLVLGLLLPGLFCGAAERVFDFSLMPANAVPQGFSSVSGGGPAGDWRIVYDEVSPVLSPLSPQAPSVARRAVLAQLSKDATDERFPLLVFDGEIFRDFTFTTSFKTVSGSVERMAGIAFRVQDPTNYYVLRASSLGNTFKFYKVVNGTRGDILGPGIEVPSGKWQELGVECKGNQFRCFLNGQQVIPTITDNSFASGKIAFWTKSDSVSYFADAKVVYTPREPPAQVLVRDLCQRHDRLLGAEIFIKGTAADSTRLIASSKQADVGRSGTKVELDVIQNGATYYGKDKKSVSVTMPLRDRNGDAIAAVRLIMRTFAGQTERNAVERAAPMVRELQQRVRGVEDLME